MKPAAGLLLALFTTNGGAATVYVTDELVLGVYGTQSTEGERLATLHSGASVETLSTSGESTRVRLADGTTGWVKSAYLTGNVPATVRVKQLQEELDRTRSSLKLVAGGPTAVGRTFWVQPLAADHSTQSHWAWLGAGALLIALSAGFWLGYATLARRIKYKFGGIKVY